MPHAPFECEVSEHVWDVKYRWRVSGEPRDRDIHDTWRRVARALAAAEKESASFETLFLEALRGFRFLPGGRILAGAGTGHRVTLFNCFVMGVIEDSLDGIFDALKEGALTMQQGGGVGYDFSTLRPRGTEAQTVGTVASGPVSFMRIWDAMCATLLSTGARRGAMMATLRCDHPDIEEFVTAKYDPRELRHFNLSVQVSDAFVEAVRRDADWPLVFPADGVPAEGGEVVHRRWTGSDGPIPCRVLRRVRARALWDRILRATYDAAEPGVLFVDRINAENNLHDCEFLTATNPCGEIPLPPYGACDLGSINLTAFVRDPFTEHAHLDRRALRALVPVAVRMLDDVVEVSRFPLPAQAERARATRRIGLGVTGLADALACLGLPYGSPEARRFAAELMREIRDAAYRASVELAREKGPFPLFHREAYLDSGFARRLPPEIRDAIARGGIRNSHLLAIAPTGTISLLANNVSSGIEPIFDFEYRRRMLERTGERREFLLVDWAVRRHRELRGEAPLPPAFVRATDLSPEQHLEMQAAIQPFVDNSISKTINVPAELPFERFRDVYDRAFDLGLKGCTTFRPNPVTGAVLEAVHAPAPEAVHCCSLEREAD